VFADSSRGKADGPVVFGPLGRNAGCGKPSGTGSPEPEATSAAFEFGGIRDRKRAFGLHSEHSCRLPSPVLSAASNT
jgi:hypothetical protein